MKQEFINSDVIINQNEWTSFNDKWDKYLD